MKRMSLILLVAALILGVGTSFSYGFDKGIYEGSSSAIKDLKNLNLLMNLTRAGKDSLKASTVVSQDSQAEITARVETNYAVIYAHKEIETPEFLTSNFDRIFEMIASYFKLKVDNEKIVVWVVDFDTLQKVYPGQRNYPEGSPWTVASVYASCFNCCLFTPRYMNDLYVTHELFHYFVGKYPEEVAAGLPQVITQRNTTDLPLQDFLRQHEEKIVLELSEIIIRKSLASLILQGV